jgi:polyisoprenoid-binding protein YceI
MNDLRRRIAAAFYFLVAAPVGIAILAALPQHAAPKPASNEIVLGVDPAQSKVHWILDTTVHTVHGTFNFKNGTLRVDPATGKAGGEIAVLATSGESGNDGRDKKMHKDVLESAQFPDVIFKPDHVEGKITTTESCSVQVHGILVLHGSEHEITVPVQAQFAGDHWTGSGKFSVPFIDWGLKNPSNFLLKVNHTVNVELDLKGTLQNPAAQ